MSTERNGRMSQRGAIAVLLIAVAFCSAARADGEQTILAKERTVLSFMRTGLASIGAGIVIINIFSTASAWIIGWAFIFSGIVEIFESYRRLRQYKKKMDTINRELGE